MKKLFLDNLTLLITFSSSVIAGLALSQSVFATDNLTVDDVLAVEADATYGEYLAGECMTCHTGKNTTASIPDINGNESATIALALLEYKYNERENETMRLIAGTLGKEEIAALTAYFSGLDK